MSEALLAHPEIAVRYGGRKAPSPVAVLRACGWLSVADAIHPGLRVDAATSSHAVFRVTAPDRRCVVVKQMSHAAAASGRSLQHDLFMYRLAGWMPAIAALLPRPVFLDESRQVVVMESLACGPCWPDPDANMPVLRPGIAGLLGQALAQLHRATQDMGLAPSPAAGVLGLGASLAVASAGRRPEVVRLMQVIVDDHALRAMLDEGLAGYRHACVIHGDLRPENWLPAMPDSAGFGVRLLDWEIAGSGDPAWDLASLIAQAVIEASREGTSESAVWPATSRTSIADGLCGYFEQPGPLVAGDATWDKLVRFVVARLLHVATEWAEQGVEIHHAPVGTLLKAAGALARSPVAASQLLHRWYVQRKTVSRRHP